MKWVIRFVFFLTALFVFLVFTLPVSFVAERVRQQMPLFYYSSASGTVWNGEISQINFGVQPIGNGRIDTNWLSLLSGRLQADLSLTQGVISARGNIAAGLTGNVELKDVRASGRTGELMGLRSEIRDLDGRFTFDLDQLKLKGQSCDIARGRAWTDILAKLKRQYEWEGPELSGPISCRNGRLFLEMSGSGPSGEIVSSELEMGLDGTGRFKAVIKNAGNDIAGAASLLGFVTLADETLVYEHEIVR